MMRPHTITIQISCDSQALQFYNPLHAFHGLQVQTDLYEAGFGHRITVINPEEPRALPAVTKADIAEAQQTDLAEIAEQQALAETLNRQMQERFSFGAVPEPESGLVDRPTLLPDGSIIEPLSIFDPGRFAPRPALLEGRMNHGQPLQIPEHVQQEVADAKRRQLESGAQADPDTSPGFTSDDPSGT